MVHPRLALRVGISPDLDAILTYLEEMVERAEVRGEMHDPQLVSLKLGLLGLAPSAMFGHDIQDGFVTLYPSDILLDFVAKFRAVERVIYAQD